MRQAHTGITLMAITFVALISAACSPVDIQPDTVNNFAAKDYRYYQWRSGPVPATKSGASSRPAIDPTVRQAVDEVLQSKGYQLDMERAQFIVGYRYGIGIRDGVAAEHASNITYQPPATINRKVDQASRDNAIALGGVKETTELKIQIRDKTSQLIVWEALLTEIVADANRVDADYIDKSLRKAIPRAMRTLPEAR